MSTALQLKSNPILDITTPQWCMGIVPWEQCQHPSLAGWCVFNSVTGEVRQYGMNHYDATNLMNQLNRLLKH